MKSYYVGVGGGVDRIHAMVTMPDQDRLKILGQERQQGSPQKGNSQHHLDRLEHVVRAALERAGLRESDLGAIGISTVGQVDYEKQMIIYSTNLDLHNFPLGEELSKRFGGAPVVVVNDVVGHMLGEQQFGVARGVKDLVYYYVDYGTGAALMFNGQMYTGANGLAGEAGHAGISLHGKLCDCGNTGCLEAICSQRALARAIHARFHQGWDFSFSGDIDLNADIETVSHLITPHIIQEAVIAGDNQIINLVHEAAEGLAYSIAGVITLLNPEMVVLGGGMLNTVQILADQAQELALQWALRPTVARVKIERSRLGNIAEIYGAVARAMQLVGD